jgi:hypothetical protein
VDVKLGGGLVEDYNPGAEVYGAKRPSQRHPLPLAA